MNIGLQLLVNEFQKRTERTIYTFHTYTHLHIRETRKNTDLNISQNRTLAILTHSHPLTHNKSNQIQTPVIATSNRICM